MEVFNEIEDYLDSLYKHKTDFLTWVVNFSEKFNFNKCKHYLNMLQASHFNNGPNYDEESQYKREEEFYKKIKEYIIEYHDILEDISFAQFDASEMSETGILPSEDSFSEFTSDGLKHFIHKNKKLEIESFLEIWESNSDISKVEQLIKKLGDEIYPSLMFEQQNIVDLLIWLYCILLLELKINHSTVFEVSRFISFRGALNQSLKSIFKTSAAVDLYNKIIYSKEFDKNYKFISLLFNKMKKEGLLNSKCSAAKFAAYTQEITGLKYSPLKIQDHLDYSSEVAIYQRFKSQIYNLHDEDFIDNSTGHQWYLSTRIPKVGNSRPKSLIDLIHSV
jgi:hypothetical protein